MGMFGGMFGGMGKALGMGGGMLGRLAQGVTGMGGPQQQPMKQMPSWLPPQAQQMIAQKQQQMQAPMGEQPAAPQAPGKMNPVFNAMYQRLMQRRGGY